MLHLSSNPPRRSRGHLSLVISRPLASVEQASAEPPAEARTRCTLCGKPIADDEVIGYLEGDPYHTDCQHIENNHFAWRATLDAIHLGLGAEIRVVFPGGNDELQELRKGLKKDMVKYSTAFTIIMTVSATLRDSMSQLNKERRDRIDANLTGINKILSDYLKGRP